MTCNCIEEFEKNVVAAQPIKDKVITRASLPTTFSFAHEKLDQRLVIEAELTIEGQKRSHKMTVAYAYCPFCGKIAANEDQSETIAGKEVVNAKTD